jgi:hypothetical protein
MLQFPTTATQNADARALQMAFEPKVEAPPNRPMSLLIFRPTSPPLCSKLPCLV